MKGAFWFLVAALTRMAFPAQNSQISIQIVNPEASARIRVFLDRKLIYQDTPARSSLARDQTVPSVAGNFTLDSRLKHILTADVASSHTKAQLEWTPGIDGSPWIVVRYYPGRNEPGEPPFFTFSLQSSQAKMK